MRHSSLIALALPFALVILTGAAPPTPAVPSHAAHDGHAAPHATASDGWPDTRAGEVARAWVEAFSAGEPAMREFNLKWLTRGSLERKSMDERLEVYRKGRDRFGKLVLASVIKSTPGELTVSLLDSDAAAHEFIFAVQTAAPFKLVSVSLREQQAGGHFGFHH